MHYIATDITRSMVFMHWAKLMWVQGTMC